MKLIPQEWVDALLRYLINKPYNEVSQIIPILQNLPEFSPPQNENPPEEPK